LTGISATAFLLAFALSPRGFRHPYLLYTSVLVFGTRLTGYLTPTLFPSSSPTSPSPATLQRRAAAAAARREKNATRRMEASYEVLGDVPSDEGTAEDDDHLLEEDELNGEEVRSDVDFFVKNQYVQGAIAGLGFAIAVVGIWGDAVYTRTSETFVIGLA
jgi:autophagy-related protein 33